MWIWYALLAGIFFTGQGLLTRHVLRGQQDAWAFSFFFSLIGAIVSFPFMLASPQVPHTWGPWLLAALVGLLLVVNNYLFFRASNYIEASLSGAVAKLKLVWVFILSVVVLQSPFSWLKLLGMLLTIAASVVIVRGIRRAGSFQGVAFALSSTIFTAVIVILYKQLFASFNVASMTFFAAFLFPAIFNFVLLPRAPRRISAIFRQQGKLVLLACFLGALANLALNAGLAKGEATSVLVVVEASLLVTLIGEHLVLKETEFALAKVTAVVLATVGAVLMYFGPS